MSKTLYHRGSMRKQWADAWPLPNNWQSRTSPLVGPPEAPSWSFRSQEQQKPWCKSRTRRPPVLVQGWDRQVQPVTMHRLVTWLSWTFSPAASTTQPQLTSSASGLALQVWESLKKPLAKVETANAFSQGLLLTDYSQRPTKTCSGSRLEAPRGIIPPPPYNAGQVNTLTCRYVMGYMTFGWPFFNTIVYLSSSTVDSETSFAPRL